MNQCPQCQAELPADAPQGMCPKCLVNVGLGDQIRETVAKESLALPSADELSQLFPALEVLELRGRGGMGAVYKARQTNLDRLVALKVLPASVASDPAFAERFAREARAMAKLSHANIVMVFDFGQVNDLYYFVMEYVDGVNLREAIATGQCDEAQALAIVAQICDALQYAHDQGIVHRDIKPENVLLDKQGRVKIADFGLAKLLDPNRAKHVTLTGTKQVVGTMHYMAPEQMERPETVDHRADLYSLGVVFYELLTGELPLGRFSPPSQKSHVDTGLDDVVMRTLEKEPERRYQQASDIKTAVQQVPVAPLAGVGDEVPPAATATVARALSVPFALPDVMGGIMRGNGIMRLSDGKLFLEFELHDQWIGMFRRPVKTIEVPVTELLDVGLREGVISTKLTFRSEFLSTFEGFPTKKREEITMHIAKRDRQQARQIVDRLRQMLHLAPLRDPQNPPPEFGAHELREAQDALWYPTLTLFVMGLIGLAVPFVMFMFSVVGRERFDETPIILASIGVPIGILGMIAGMRLWRCQSLRFGGIVTCVAMLPIHFGFVLAWISGVWLLVLCRRPLIRHAFQWTEQQRKQEARYEELNVPPEKVLPTTAGAVGSSVGSGISSGAGSSTDWHSSAVAGRRWANWGSIFHTIFKSVLVLAVLAGIAGWVYLKQVHWKVGAEYDLLLEAQTSDRVQPPEEIKYRLSRRLRYPGRDAWAHVDYLGSDHYRIGIYSRHQALTDQIMMRVQHAGRLRIDLLAHPEDHQDVVKLAMQDKGSSEVRQDDAVVARWVSTELPLDNKDQLVVRRRADGKEVLMLVTPHSIDTDDLDQVYERSYRDQSLFFDTNRRGVSRLRKLRSRMGDVPAEEARLGVVIDDVLRFVGTIQRTMRDSLVVVAKAEDYEVYELRDWVSILMNPLPGKLRPVQ